MSLMLWRSSWLLRYRETLQIKIKEMKTFDRHNYQRNATGITEWKITRKIHLSAMLLHYFEIIDEGRELPRIS